MVNYIDIIYDYHQENNIQFLEQDIMFYATNLVWYPSLYQLRSVKVTYLFITECAPISGLIYNGDNRYKLNRCNGDNRYKH